MSDVRIVTTVAKVGQHVNLAKSKRASMYKLHVDCDARSCPEHHFVMLVCKNSMTVHDNLSTYTP